ncbi:xylulokinase [Rhodococcus aetherivorans]
MTWYVLGVDIGTTAIKAALFGADGAEVAEHTAEYDLLTPRAGYVELEPDTYIHTFAHAVTSLLRESTVDVSSIRALGLSAQGETMLCLDSHDQPLGRAIVWMDNRASAESDEIEQHFGRATIHAVTGQPAMDPIWPAAKILWLRRNDPARFAATARFALLKDFIVQRLTGRLVSEDSLLCSTLFWDINTRQYWPDMLDYLGIDNAKLPEIAPQGEIIGALKSSAAAELGLPAGLPVSVGALDQACGALGLGNVTPGIFSESTGSALTTVTVVDELRLDPAGRVPCFAAALPGQYMLHTFSTGGMVMRWFRDQFCSTEKQIEELCGINAYQLIDEEVRQIEPGCDGLVVLPHLQGSGPPDLDPHARGAFFGLTLSHSKQHLARGVMEGVAMVLRRMISSTEDLGVKIEEIISLSGGAKSAVWCQIKADATGRPVHTVSGAGSAGCRGAAIIAGVAVGLWHSAVDIARTGLEFHNTYKPDTANIAAYDDLYTRFLALQEATKAIPHPASPAT